MEASEKAKIQFQLNLLMDDVTGLDAQLKGQGVGGNLAEKMKLIVIMMKRIVDAIPVEEE